MQRGRPPKGSTAPEYPRLRRGFYEATRTERQRGLTASYCWCEASMLLVPERLVVSGKTGSCGRPSCAEPEAVAS